MTLEEFNKIPDGEVFATGILPNSPEGIYMTELIMNNLEKEIEKAAKSQLLRNFSIDSQDEFSAIKLKLTSVKDEMIEFAKSEEAKEYHTHALKIEMIAKCAKMQVELKKSLYTEEKVIRLLHGIKVNAFEAAGYTHTPSFSVTKNWFNNNKKK